MSKVNGKKLSYAALHYPIFVPDLGQIGPTLTSKATGSSRAVKMTVDEPFILLEVENKLKQIVTLPIPITSFTHTVLENQVAAPVSQASKGPERSGTITGNQNDPS